MTKEEELAFWRDVGINLLTDSQLDARMRSSGKTPREVLAVANVRPIQTYVSAEGFVPGLGNTRDWVFKRTSDTRPPRRGEWYLSGAKPAAYFASADYTTPFRILERVR